MRAPLSLPELRRHLHRSQKSLSIPQPDVSRIESRGPMHIHISTLQRYLQALGCDLEVSASMNGQRFRISLDPDEE